MSQTLSVTISQRSLNESSAKCNKLSGGEQFPSIVLTTERGEMINLQTSNNRARLIVFFRGSFCDFCEEPLRQINEHIDVFRADNIDVIAVSADSVAESRELSDRLGLRYPIACGLTVEQMEMLGLFIHTRDPHTSPKYAYCSSRRREGDGGNAPIKAWRKPFCEPAHFFLRPNNTIKYQQAPDALYHL